MKKKIASSFGLTLLSSGLLFGFNFAIAKILGANTYGQISYYLSFVQIVILLISFNYAALYMGNKITREDSNTFSLFVTVESLMFAIISIPAFFIINAYVKNVEIVILILLIAYFTTIAVLVGLDFNAEKKVAQTIIYSTLIPRIILVVFFSVFVVLDLANAKTYMYIYMFGFMVVAVYFLIKLRPSLYIKKSFFTRAWKFYLLGIIGTSVTYIAQIAQKEYGSYAELASLSIALLLIAGLGLVGSILIKFALPKIHEAWKEKDINKLGSIYTTHTFLSSMINIPILIFLLFYIDFISDIIGEGYATLPKVFLILAVGYLVDMLTGITGTILRATEHEHIEIYNEIFRFIMGIGLIVLLHEQPYGIAYAISASMVIYNIAKFFQVYRLFNIRPIYLEQFIILVLAMIFVAMVCYLSSHYLVGWISFFVGIIGLTILYIVFYKVVRQKVDLGVYR
jgi:O-antigen/teichoic acid export membrane protein